MAEGFFREDEMANEITRPELLTNQPLYRRKGKRFTENLAGYAMLAKPGTPEAYMNPPRRPSVGQGPIGDARRGKPYPSRRRRSVSACLKGDGKGWRRGRQKSES